MDTSLQGLTRAKTAPAAWGRVRAEVEAAPDLASAWPLLRDVLALPGSKVEPDALALLDGLLRRADPEEALRLVASDSPRGAAALRLAAVNAVEACAGRVAPPRLLEALAPHLRDRDERVRERAATALGVLAMHAPAEVGPYIQALAASQEARETQAAAVALWGLAVSDLTAGLAVFDVLLARADPVAVRRALVQLGFAYRFRPFTAAERQAFWAALARAVSSSTGPGRRAVLEVARPLAPFNEQPAALEDLDRFMATQGRARSEESYAKPGPRPRAPCAACGHLADYAVYFCPECGDVKPHNPLRALRGLPVERGPVWPKG